MHYADASASWKINYSRSHYQNRVTYVFGAGIWRSGVEINRYQYSILIRLLDMEISDYSLEEFVADHPFICIIRQRSSTLFMGRQVNASPSMK